MKILIKTLGFNGGEALHQHIDRRLSAVLAHGADQLKRVIVRLFDNNGPGKGGEDKACSIHLEGFQGQPVVVFAVSSDYYSAVDFASRRAGRAAERALGRRQAWRRY